MGNSLRRTLLSSLEGAAVRTIRIENVLHEFSTIPGVLEDVLEIILNIKQLRLKMERDEETVLRIDARKKGEIRGGDIQTEAGVEIVNTDLLIATLNDSGTFKAEMTATALECRGFGAYPDRTYVKDIEFKTGSLMLIVLFVLLQAALVYLERVV